MMIFYVSLGKYGELGINLVITLCLNIKTRPTYISNYNSY